MMKTRPSHLATIQFLPSQKFSSCKQQSPSAFTTSAARPVDEFLQLFDYESSDNVSPSIHGSGQLDWIADIGLFTEQMSSEFLAAAEVTELGFSSAASAPASHRPAKSAIVLKKPRVEISDDEFFIVPDLG